MAGILAVTIVCAQQQTTIDSAVRPGSYKLKVGQFRSYPNSKKDIIFLGNSITAGAEWSELLQNQHARNRGISGDITFGVLERLDEVTEGKPAKVFILIGINDISWPGQAFGRPVLGEEASIAAIGVDDLHGWTAKYYRPQGMVLACAGKVELSFAHDKIDLADGDTAILTCADDATLTIAPAGSADCYLVLLRPPRNHAG